MTGFRFGFTYRLAEVCAHRRLGWLVLVATVVASLHGAPARGQGLGDLIVSPTRVVFEGRIRSEQVVLANQGTETVTYRISLINMAMDEIGNLSAVEVPPEGAPNAAKLIRYAPRAVTIPPGGSQIVRVAVRKPSGLPAGEYRSHMLFRAVPPENTGVSVAATPESDAISIQLIPVYGISIPLIVRHGELVADTAFSELALERDDDGVFLAGKLTRGGNGSVFGDITVDYTRAGGDTLLIGEMRRLAVYPPMPFRRFRVALRLPDGVELQGGTLNIAFSHPEGDQAPMAAANLPVN